MDWRNKMKRLLLTLSLLLVAGSVYAGPLDLIFDAPGDVWGRFDASVNPSNYNHAQGNIEQGIRFDHLTWLTFYGGFTYWQEFSTAKVGYWQAGVKNTTWLENWIFGIEEQDYVIADPVLPQGEQHFVVAYVSTSYSWNLRKYK